MIAALLLRFWPYIAIAALGAALYWQIGLNGKKSAQIAERDAVIVANNQAIERMQRESRLTEVVLVAHAGKVETITEVKEVEKVRIREVLRNAPDNDCAVTAASPVILDCLRFDACESTAN